MSAQKIKEKGKVFRDPVHRLIRVEPGDQFILNLINTPEFQRLRRVRQLGVSSFTYHGAEHSRFVHSLGVFNFAQRILSALQRRYGPNHDVTLHLEEHARVIKAAALLHDIGHGPFSHMIERAAAAAFEHEKMTIRLITDPSTSVHKALKESAIPPEEVASVIAGDYQHRLIVDIVSSQLDADRMDYLLRDSLMTGVEYGVYDAEWLLNAMCVGRDPASDDQNAGKRAWRLCLDRERGLFAAEQLILARHHMMLQVYMHRVTRGYEVMLLSLFKRAAEMCSTGKLPPGTPSVVSAYFKLGLGMTLDDWLVFDETAMVAAMQTWSTASSPEHLWLKKCSLAFLRRSRLYKGFPVGKLGVKKSMELASELSKSHLHDGSDWGLDNGEHLPYKGVYFGASKGGAEEEASTLSILLSEGDPAKRGKPIENESNILKGLDNDPQSVARLYIDREKLVAAQPVLKRLGIVQGGEA